MRRSASPSFEMLKPQELALLRLRHRAFFRLVDLQPQLLGQKHRLIEAITRSPARRLRDIDIAVVRVAGKKR